MNILLTVLLMLIPACVTYHPDGTIKSKPAYSAEECIDLLETTDNCTSNIIDKIREEDE